MLQRISIGLFLILLTGVNPVFANQDDNLNLPHIFIQPGTIYYPLVRLWEKFVYSLSLTKQAKIDFNRGTLKTKVAELKEVVDDKKLGEVETSSQRVSYYAGVLTDLVIEKNHSDQNKENIKMIKKQTVGDFESYNKLLANLRDHYSANSSFWLLIQHNINSINALMVKLDNEVK